jgi:FkbM family methyltransferase
MKKIADRIIYFILNRSSAAKNKTLTIAVEHFKNNRNDFEYFLKEMFLKENENYPSLLNNGYLHIDKAIEFARFFNLPPGNLILDVGAANGITPVRFAKAFPFSVIYSFEPIPNTFQELKRETAAYPTIHAINKALGNEIKPLNMHLAARITSSSLFGIEKNLSNDFWAENLKEEGTIEVQMSKLDIEVPQDMNVNILKMDVQGYELEVLKGGTETLKRTALVLVEMQNHDLYTGAPKYYDIDNLLRENGFELYDMIPSIRQDKKLYEWDAIYVNKNSKK